MYGTHSRGTQSFLLISVTDVEIVKTETSFLALNICLHNSPILDRYSSERQ